MIKRHKRSIVIVTISLLTLSFAFFVFFESIGPGMNDKMAEKQMDAMALQFIETLDGVELLERSNFVGVLESESDFVVWVGVAVKTNLSLDELTLKVKSMPNFENAKIMPYTMELANQLNFTGVQKDLMNQSAAGCYIIGITLKPATILDKRKT